MGQNAKKTCNGCGIDKTFDHFYAATRGGYCGKCKECTKARVRKNRRSRIDYYRKYDRERYLRSGARGDAAPESKRRAKVSWAQRNPEKRRAQVAVSNALRDGRLRREPCCVCGEKKTQAHHEDYGKPLAVIWLCSEHHAAHHRIEDAVAQALAAAEANP